MRRRWVLRYMWTDPDIIILHQKMYWLGQVNDLVRGRYVRKGHNNVIWKFYFLVILSSSFISLYRHEPDYFTAVLHKHLSKFAPECITLTHLNSTSSETIVLLENITHSIYNRVSDTKVSAHGTQKIIMTKQKSTWKN